MRQSRIKLGLFYQLFIDHFWHILLFFGLGLNTSLFESGLKQTVRILKWFKMSQVLKLFSFVLDYLRQFRLRD